MADFERYHTQCCEFISNLFIKRNRNDKRATKTTVVKSVFMAVQATIISKNVCSIGFGDGFGDDFGDGFAFGFVSESVHCEFIIC